MRTNSVSVCLPDTSPGVHGTPQTVPGTWRARQMPNVSTVLAKRSAADEGTKPPLVSRNLFVRHTTVRTLLQMRPALNIRQSEMFQCRGHLSLARMFLLPKERGAPVGEQGRSLIKEYNQHGNVTACVRSGYLSMPEQQNGVLTWGSLEERVNQS